MITRKRQRRGGAKPKREPSQQNKPDTTRLDLWNYSFLFFFLLFFCQMFCVRETISLSHVQDHPSIHPCLPTNRHVYSGDGTLPSAF